MTPLRLRRPPARSAGVPLTPLVDVLLILVIFFLVTSTYLNLGALPLTASADAEPSDAVPDATADEGGPPGTILLRLAPDGTAWLRGRPLDASGLEAALNERPRAVVALLASPAATVQALADALAVAAAAGARDVRVLRPGEPAR